MRHTFGSIVGIPWAPAASMGTQGARIPPKRLPPNQRVAGQNEPNSLIEFGLDGGTSMGTLRQTGT